MRIKKEELLKLINEKEYGFEFNIQIKSYIEDDWTSLGDFILIDRYDLNKDKVIQEIKISFSRVSAKGNHEH